MSEFSENRRYYRETVQGSGHGEGKCIKDSGGRGLYGHVVLSVEPADRGSGTRIIWNAGSSVAADFTAGIIEGVYDVLHAGLIADVEMVDIQVSIDDGSYHEGDSTLEAFRAAARQATEAAVREAGSVLLESVTEFTLTVPTLRASAVEDVAARSGGRVSKKHETGDEVNFEIQISPRLAPGLMAKLLAANDGHSISMTFGGYEIKPLPPDTMEPWVRVRA